MDATPLGKTISRDVRGVKCPCGGYAEEVSATDEEIESAYNCGRSWACCAAVFVCCLCGKRLIAKREAPDFDIS